MAKYKLKRLFSNTPKQRKYTLKRKIYGFGDAAGNALNTATNTAANVINTGVDMAKNATGGLVEGAGRATAAMAKPLGTIAQIGGTALLGIPGLLATTALKKGTEAIGKGVQHAGENMQT